MAGTPPSAPIATTLGIISKPLHVKLLQTIAIFASCFLSGQAVTLSGLTMPALLQTRSAGLLARQWRTVFKRGLVLGPACIIPSQLIFGWLAWREPSIRTTSFKLYTTASAVLLGTLPYTEVLMAATNKELLKRSDEAIQHDMEAGDVEDSYESQSVGTFIQNQYGHGATKTMQQSTHRLVDNWALLNVGRGFMFFVAGLCGTWATINEDLSFFELLP